MSAISRCNFNSIIILTVVLFIYSAYSVDEHPTVSPDYFKENGGCAGLNASMCPDERELNCTLEPIFDVCGICRTCPKMEGEVCGGSYYKYGLCAPPKHAKTQLYCNQNGTHVQRDVIMTGIDVIGVCKRKSITITPQSIHFTHISLLSVTCTQTNITYVANSLYNMFELLYC